MKPDHLISLLRALPVVILVAAALCSCQSGGGGRVAYQTGSVKTASLVIKTPPPNMTFETKGSTFASEMGLGIGGLAGLALASAGNEAALTPEQRLRQFYMGEVTKHLAAEITARKQFKLVPEGAGEGVLEVYFGQWGIRYVPGGFWSGQMAAMAGVGCSLKDRNGKVVWHGTAANPQMAWFSHTTVFHTREQFAASPELVRRELSSASRHIARQLAGSLPLGTAARVP